MCECSFQTLRQPVRDRLFADLANEHPPLVLSQFPFHNFSLLTRPIADRSLAAVISPVSSRSITRRRLSVSSRWNADRSREPSPLISFSFRISPRFATSIDFQLCGERPSVRRVPGRASEPQNANPAPSLRPSPFERSAPPKPCICFPLCCRRCEIPASEFSTAVVGFPSPRRLCPSFRAVSHVHNRLLLSVTLARLPSPVLEGMYPCFPPLTSSDC